MTKEKGELRAAIKANILVEIVKVARILVDEVKINVDNGFNFRIVDNAHVAIVEGNFPSQLFDEYHSNKFSFGVDLDKLNEFLRNVSSKRNSTDTVQINYMAATNKLELQIGNIRNCYGLLDITGMSEPKIPQLRLPNKVVIDANTIQDYLRNNQQISDVLSISWNEDKLIISMVGDTDTSTLEIPNRKGLWEHHKIGEPKAVSKFSFDYFKSYIGIIRGEVEMSWGDDYPVLLEWKVATLGNVKALLAPRIEDAED